METVLYSFAWIQTHKCKYEKERVIIYKEGHQ